MCSGCILFSSVHSFRSKLLFNTSFVCGMFTYIRVSISVYVSCHTQPSMHARAYTHLQLRSCITDIYAHMQRTAANTHTLSLSLFTHTRALSLSLTHTHTFNYTHTHSLTLYPPPPPHTHTHTRTHSHKFTQAHLEEMKGGRGAEQTAFS